MRMLFNLSFLAFFSLVFANLSLARVDLPFDSAPLNYLIDHQISEFNDQVNRDITLDKDKYFAALSFKAFIEKNTANIAFKNKILKSLQSIHLPLKPKMKAKLVINMGLGWDANNYQQQPYYVKNFIDEINMSFDPLQTIFLDRFPYAPIEQNIETIKPQIKNLLRNNKIILLSLCKGTPEMLIAISEIVRENPELEKNILGYINMSGMLGGTYLADERVDIHVLRELEAFFDQYLPTKSSFTKYDRQQTVWSLPFMRPARVKNLINQIKNIKLNNVVAYNISGIMTSDKISKRATPLKMFINYNNLTKIFPYANDGFLDITETRLPKEIFPNQKTMLVESSHLIADGYFEEYDLMEKLNRLKFYQAILNSMIDEIKK